MIKISKPNEVPEKLQTEGNVENNKNCADYLADSESYHDGRTKFDIKNSIYGHSSVKGPLRDAQHNKCCYCEKDLKDEDGAVEHFRPKGGYKKGKKLIRPGYYWLGYKWSNLFFVCSRCNSAGNKGNLFPLLDESKRVKSHEGDINEEAPLLLDPGGEGENDPRKHIIFEGQFPRYNTYYGEKTIVICGLNRDELNNNRKKLIDDIESRIAILKTRSVQKKSIVEKAKIFIKDSIKANAEFSATAIDYLSEFNITLD